MRVAILAVWCCASVWASEGYRPPTAEERWNEYVRTTYRSPGVPFRILMPAILDHVDGTPEEWGTGADALGRRIAARSGFVTVRSTFEAAGAAALGHDPRYLKCECSGFGSRMKYALSRSVLTVDSHGRTTVHFARIGAAYGSEAAAAALWMPPSVNVARETLRGGSQRIAFAALTNVVREFMPELKRAFRLGR